MSIVDAHIASWCSSPLGERATEEAWDIVANAAGLVTGILATLDADYEIEGDIAVHRTTTVETGAVMKGPLIVGPNCLVAAACLFRGGCWIDSDCIVGPGAELKTTLMFQGSKLAHFNFVGDSILGSDINLEAGSIIANYRNDLADPRLRINYSGKTIESDTLKFGALVGDGCRIGANAVVAPGAILAPRTVVPRLGLIDQRTRS
ncbi:LpxA family transferase [Methylobacterium sp. Leaf112]|uniref:LpxA family transferase n=1 Tax=Methylobacterium sp. Leaf112 TaxID=1736258 RepID=UPI0006FE5FB0|nr:LpxA family transferase [Methylobacterium sp. Leaf112]KQP58323.1 LpxA family transferase [Methylobacterium sp. Leaf112]